MMGSSSAAAVFLVLLIASLAGTSNAVAQDKPSTKDRAILADCLDAARSAKKAADTCIGTLQDSCMRAPGNDSMASMSGCVGREVALWDERLNAAYKAALASDLASQNGFDDGSAAKKSGGEILRDAQRAWLTFRALKCKAARLPMEGGSGATLLGGTCFLRETARQAIWLEHLPIP